MYVCRPVVETNMMVRVCYNVSLTSQVNQFSVEGLRLYGSNGHGIAYAPTCTGLYSCRSI